MQVLAIPITVISTNFNHEFNQLKKQRMAMRNQMALLRMLNASKG
jgi:hypothetical protein